MIERRLHLLVILALAFFLIASLTSMSQKSPTMDEPTYLAAGYSYLVARDFRGNPEHPPLMKMIAAAPLLLLDLDFRWGDPRLLPGEFTFRNTLPPDVIIFWGRVPIVLMGAALGWFVFWWSRQLAGSFAGILALALYVFDPNLLAHSQLATTDLGLALFFAVAVYSLVRHLAGPTRVTLWVAGAAFGLALLTKSSALLLVPVYAALSLGHRLRQGVAAIWACWWRLGAVMIVMTVVLAFVVYGFEVRTTGRPPTTLVSLLERHTSPSSLLRRAVLAIGSAIPVPAPSFWRGMMYQARHSLESPGYGYLRGQVYGRRRLDYFPVAFAVKTPVGTMGLLFAALAVFAYRVLVRRASATVSPAEWGIPLSVAVFFGLSMLNKFNIGLRYILPVYPLMFIFIASQLVWLGARVGGRVKSIVVMSIVALVAFVAVSSLRIYPHYLAYFNEFAGGPGNGWRYLADSNLDWGQDLPGLKAYMRRHNIDEVYLSYFGPTPVVYYGIRSRPLPTNDEVARTGVPRGVVAVSVSSLLLGLREDSWVWDYRPTATIGHSIWIFDLRHGGADTIR